MKQILLILLLIYPAMTVAQDESDDPYVECAEVLSSSPANRLAEMSEDGTYGMLSNRMLRPYLIGRICSVEQITEYMLRAGWKTHRRGIERFEAVRESETYSYDKVKYFCLPERGLWRLINSCRGSGSFFWLDNKITYLRFVPQIRFGG